MSSGKKKKGGSGGGGGGASGSGAVPQFQQSLQQSAAANAALLRQVYTELAKSETAGDYERALKAANRILKLRQNDATAFRCKIVCLVQLQKFEETLQLLRKTTQTLTSGTVFEKAYSEYRLNHNEEALKTLTGPNSEGADDTLEGKELLAQLYYRMERYEDSKEIYRALLKETADNYDQERRANLLAVQAQISAKGAEAAEMSGVVLKAESYEERYNEGCRLAALAKHVAALKQLNKAEQLCREVLSEDGVGEEEIEDELATIRAQMTYCKLALAEQRKGEESDEKRAKYADEAATVCLQILKQKPSDTVALAVASNNSLVAGQLRSHTFDQLNQFDARKKLKLCQGKVVEAKMTSAQRRILCLNGGLLQLHANQLELCRRAAVELRDKYAMDKEAAILESALLWRQKDADGAKHLLVSLKNERDLRDADVEEIDFVLAQLSLNEGKAKATVEVLSDLECSHRPAMVSLVTALHLSLDDSESAVKTLRNACDFYRQHEPDSENFRILLDQCGKLCAKVGEERCAAVCLEELRIMRPNDARLLGQLIEIYSRFDADKAEEISRSALEKDGDAGDGDVDNAEEALDVDELENADWILFGERYRIKKEAKQQQTPKAGAASSEGVVGGLKWKPKRKRKNRLPKNHNPDDPPADPERWLPKQQRSTFKKKKDKRAKDRDRDIGRGTQGAVAGQPGTNVAQLDATLTASPGGEKAAAAAKETVTVGVVSSPTPGPRQQRPQNKQKKKRAGGKKW